ncbi:hypothetical protein [Methylomagnum sp.]
MPCYRLKLSKRLDHRIPYGLTLTQVSASQNDMVWIVHSQEVRPNAKTCVICVPVDLPAQGQFDVRMLTLHYADAPRLVDRVVLATERLDEKYKTAALVPEGSKDGSATILDLARKGMNLFRPKSNTIQTRLIPAKAWA